jgi:hypothetical protein
MHDFI